jgi:uncharacterized repeat protein (TIGR03803 family)
MGKPITEALAAPTAHAAGATARRRRPVASWLAIGVASLAPTAMAAQDAVLELWNPGTAAGSIEVSSPAVSCATRCSVVAPEGGTVTLTAAPAPGNEFDGWAGDCAGMQSSCTLLVDGTKFVTASFAPAGQAVQVIHRFLPGATEGESPFGGLLPFGGYVYGITSAGGRYRYGTLFRELPDGSQHTVIHDFVGGAADGNRPVGSLIELGGMLYGVAQEGGPAERGILFRIDPDGGDFTIVHAFLGGPSDGAFPSNSVTIVGGVLYGVSSGGGAKDHGTVFKVGPDGSGFALLHSFAAGPADGASPLAPLVAVGDELFGTTNGGGPAGLGTIFGIGLDGSGFAVLHLFGATPSDGFISGSPLVAADGVLYGVTVGGGEHRWGTVYRLVLDGSGYAVLHSFGSSPDGALPNSLVALSGSLYGVTPAGGAFARGTMFEIRPDGSDYRTVRSFTGGPNGISGPTGPLLAFDGALRGMAGGGSAGYGAVFEIQPDGSAPAILHSFAVPAYEGRDPVGSLTGSGNVLYGATSMSDPVGCTSSGGQGSCPGGTVYKLSPDGTGYQVLAILQGNPSGAPAVFGGHLLGMTRSGIYRLDLDGSDFSSPHAFTGYPSDGDSPAGALVELGGALYGVTVNGGAGPCSFYPIGYTGCGTVFKISPDGSGYAVVHSFDGPGSDGEGPSGSLLALDAALYGTTVFGGSGDCYPQDIGCGTVFRMGPSGTPFDILHSFAGGASDGAWPSGSLIAFEGKLYGMTGRGGSSDCGTIFSMNADGTGYSVLHSFAGQPLANWGTGSLVEAGGVLYGVGGGHNSVLDSIFRINPDGSGFAIVRTLAGADGGTTPSSGSLTVLGGSLLGVATYRAISGSDVVGGSIYRVDLPSPRPTVRRHVPRL